MEFKFKRLLGLRIISKVEVRMAKKDKSQRKSNSSFNKAVQPVAKPKSSAAIPVPPQTQSSQAKIPAPGTSLLVSGPPKPVAPAPVIPTPLQMPAVKAPAPKTPDPATTPTVLALPPVEDLLKNKAKTKSDPNLKAVSKKKETTAKPSGKVSKRIELPPPAKPKTPIPDYPTLLTEFDLHLLSEGTHWHAYEKLGAHPMTHNGVAGYHFAVWAPNAEEVSVIGDFNGFDADKNPMRNFKNSGFWIAWLPGIKLGACYKYFIVSNGGSFRSEKSDPYGFHFEMRPKSASVTWDLHGYGWTDQEWMSTRKDKHTLKSPISIYEVHLGSWMRVPEEGNRWLTYRELAPKMAAYVKELGFTHIELLPITEHPFDASWGYQTIGYFAPTSRFGTPQDFMYFVDVMHQNGIGVLLDWVPAHFPRDGHGLGYFDGTHLYEHSDPRKGAHQDWGTLIFNYGRWEVSNFLIANALFWLDKFHLDGFRVDAVASMLYLDYSRKEGEWVPNQYGGRENLEAIHFLRRLNECVYGEFPDVVTIAEESTAWPSVSKPTYLGGLGFGLKWDMGWMNDTLRYISKEPIHRKHHHNDLTFRMLYAFTENFVLPLSHDEVSHGKGSMIAKMPGDDWQKFANLRVLYGYMFFQPAKKHLFMGAEFGQRSEWNCDNSLEWHLMQYAPHLGLKNWVRDLNATYRAEAGLHYYDADPAGFEWVDCNDGENSVISLLRKGPDKGPGILAVFNFTPVPRLNYRMGVNEGGYWKEILNSDSEFYGGSNVGNNLGMFAEETPCHGRPWSLNINIPPLGMVAFKRI